MHQQKKVLLNLDQEMYDKLATSADDSGLSVTEWLRSAIRLKLDAPEKPPTMPLFESVEAGRIQTSRIPLAAQAQPLASVAEQIQSSDKRTGEYWLNQIRQWRGMAPQERTAELMKATGGTRPPAELFLSADRLAKWLTENAK